MRTDGFVPAPRLAAVAWLIAPFRSTGAEGDAELRQSLTRGLPAVLVSAMLTVFIASLAAYAHPTWPFVVCFILHVALALFRVPLLLGLILAAKPGRGRDGIQPSAVDLFVCSGTLWSGLVGIGTMLCFAVSDPGLSILSALLAMGTGGAQCARNPSSPRLNVLQMSLVIGPLSIGAALSTIPYAGFAAALVPLYLLSMILLTRALHADYVNLIVTRLDNRRRATHCPLTDLPNRTAFNERLASSLTEACAPPVVMYLDLDGFKAVNDRYGHPVGDLLLIHVAARLGEQAPPDALLARLGGDEFALLLPGAEVPAAAETARAIVASLGRPFTLEEAGSVQIGVSIGIARGQPGTTPHSVVQRADAALYEAKRAGRGVFRWDGGDGSAEAAIAA